MNGTTYGNALYKSLAAAGTVVLVLILSADAGAAGKSVSFEDMGYAKDVHLSGAAPEFSLYLTNPKGLKKATAEVILRLSDVLDETSTITVLIDNVPLFTKSLKQVGREPVLSFDVKLTRADYIKVAVRGHFQITGDVCIDIPTGNMWMVVSNKSRFMMENETGSDTIANFFRNFDRNYNIVFDRATVGFDVLPLVYHINKMNDWKNITVTTSDKLVEGMRNIVVGDYGRDMEIINGNLFLSGAGVQMIKKSLMDLYITSSVQNSAVSANEADRPKELSFADVGIKGTTMTGIGDLSFNAPLRYAFFSGVPRDLNLKLVLYHTPVPEEDRAFLKIFLNGVLIKAVQLKEAGGLATYEVKVPEELLKGYNNNLNVVASYSINRGDCKGSIPNMTISILDTSYFFYQEVSRERIGGISDVLGSMSGRVLVMLDDRNMLNYGIYLMDILGRFNRDISAIDTAQMRWQGVVPKGYDYVILLVNPVNAHGFNMPLVLNQGRFAIVNPLTRKKIFTAGLVAEAQADETMGSDYSDGFGILQAFDDKDSKILMLSYYKDINALEFLKKFGREDVNKLRGNVALFNHDIATYDVGEKYRVTYEDIKPLEYYWDRFKLVIVLALGLMVMAFLFGVYRKLVRK